MNKHTLRQALQFVVAAFALASMSAALLPSSARAQAKATVVEEIIARVNNDIITQSDYQHADMQLKDEIAHDCQNCPPDKLAAEYKDQQKDLLRGLIDQSLMVQRAKDMGLSVESDLIKRLDDVRKQNNLNSIEDLEKAVEGSGLPWEDYKTQIRNGMLTQEVIRREVGSHINIPTEEVKTYYDAHPQEFTRPEQVVLTEIFLSTEGKSPEEMESVQQEGGRFAQSRGEGRRFQRNRQALFRRQYRQGWRRSGHLPAWPARTPTGRGRLQDGQRPDHRRDSDQNRFRSFESRKPLSGRSAALGQSRKRNHEQAVHGKNAAHPAHLPRRAARGKLRRWSNPATPIPPPFPAPA